MNRTDTALPRDETTFTRGAWAVLLIAVLLVGLGIFTIVNRYSLPTDGWSYLFGDQDLIYDVNLAGATSELRSGDGLTAVDGIPLDQIMNDPMRRVYHQVPPGWHVGGRVTYTMLRDGHLLPVDVPVVTWTPAAVWHALSDDPGTLAGDMGIVFMLAVTLFAFVRRPGNAAARLLLLIGATGTALKVIELLPGGMSVQFDVLANVLYALFNQLLVTVFAPLILAFTFIFPRPKAIIHRHPWLAWLPFVWAAALEAGLILGFRGDAAWIIFLLTMTLSIASMIHSALTMRDSVSRAQIRWALGGFGLGMLFLLLDQIFGLFDLTVGVFFKALHSILGGGLSLPIMGVSLAIAVLRYRLFDIDVIIRRTVVYGLLTALLAGIYFSGVIVLQQVFVAITGQRSELAIILSTLAIAALFGPLRNGIQVVIDRRFFRRKYDSQQALASFAAALRDETHPNRLATQVFDAVDQTMQPERIALWIEKI